MNFEEKCNYAIKELEKAGILESNYNPPFTRLLHKLGFEVPFPHYNSFIKNMLFTGIFFGVFWGLIMHLFFWSVSTYISIVSASIAGVLFGIAMASYYMYGFKKYNLTPWDEITYN